MIHSYSLPINPESIQAKVWLAKKNCKLNFLEKFGIYPKGICLCHKCDNIYGACINPDHLFLGTNSDNIKDMWKKNRSKAGQTSQGAVKAWNTKKLLTKLQITNRQFQKIKSAFNKKAKSNIIAILNEEEKEIIEIPEPELEFNVPKRIRALIKTEWTKVEKTRFLQNWFKLFNRKKAKIS